VLRAGEQREHGALLANEASLEHDDAVGDARDDAEVVRNEQEREAELGAQLGEQLEDAACTDTSSADVISSQTTRSGLAASARAIATR
jgi:hypothetical protein